MRKPVGVESAGFFVRKCDEFRFLNFQGVHSPQESHAYFAWVLAGMNSQNITNIPTMDGTKYSNPA